MEPKTHPLVTSLLDRMPPKLYKYCPVSDGRIDRIKRYLLSSELYFSSMTSFNDPNDCNVPFSFDCAEDVARNFWEEMAQVAAPSETKEAREKHIRDLIEQTKTGDGPEKLAQQQYKKFQKHGILCLTKHPNNVLMWAHYADAHAGIALRLNMTRENIAAIDAEAILTEATYHTDFPVIDFYGDQVEKIIRFLGVKAKAWDYEDEWRIALVAMKDHVRVAPEMIDGVVFGLRTSGEDERLVREWVKERKTSTELLRIRQKRGSFDLEVIQA